MNTTLKPLHWMATALANLRECPEEVQDDIGYALHIAQEGGMHHSTKPLQGFSSAGVLEIVDNHDGNTYRAVYTVKFALAIYVLHVFQKKSKKGISTPKAEIDLVKSRLLRAAAHYEQTYGKK
jgi:phage-related protein